MIGESITQTITVGEAHLACAVGSGSLRVYATPMLAALMENAACALLEQFLKPGQTSVGTRLELSHDAPTPCGMQVWATATITAQEGRRVDFLLTARDEAGEIGKAAHSRVIVDAIRFQDKADAKGKKA